MICPHCNNQTPEGETCVHCGAALHDADIGRMETQDQVMDNDSLRCPYCGACLLYTSQLRLLVHVHLSDRHAGPFCGHLIDDRGNHAAGAAPACPEIQQHRPIGLLHLFCKVLAGNRLNRHVSASLSVSLAGMALSYRFREGNTVTKLHSGKKMRPAALLLLLSSLYGIVAVSYTHLDVYKIQSLHSKCGCPKGHVGSNPTFSAIQNT